MILVGHLIARIEVLLIVAIYYSTLISSTQNNTSSVKQFTPVLKESDLTVLISITSGPHGGKSLHSDSLFHQLYKFTGSHLRNGGRFEEISNTMTFISA